MESILSQAHYLEQNYLLYAMHTIQDPSNFKSIKLIILVNNLIHENILKYFINI